MVYYIKMKNALEISGWIISIVLPVVDGVLMFWPGLSFEARAAGLALLCPSIPCAIWFFANGLATHLHPEKDGQL